MTDVFKYNNFIALNENTIDSDSDKKSNNSLITDLCVGMLLINPSFLDDILDRGLRSRYTQNTEIFLSDLKTLVMKPNKLKLGVRGKIKFMEDNEISKLNNHFNEFSRDFDMVRDWSKLNKAREIYRNIVDKLLMNSDSNEKLTVDLIKTVYFLGPNKIDKIDLVIETNDGKQFPIIINNRFPFSSTSNFTKIYSIIAANDMNQLFQNTYAERWNKLVREWVKLIYMNATTEFRLMIDNFIEISRVDSLEYHKYFDITISDPKYKTLGKLFEPLNNNYKYLHELLTDIYHDKSGIKDFDTVKEKWESIKKNILSSSIIEHLMIESFKKLSDGLEKTTDNYYIANNPIKMRFMRILVTILKSSDSNTYYFDKQSMLISKSKKWYRDNYNLFRVYFKYHKSILSDDTSGNIIDVRYEYNNKTIIDMKIETGFGSKEMSGKLRSKVTVDCVSNFNILIS